MGVISIPKGLHSAVNAPRFHSFAFVRKRRTPIIALHKAHNIDKPDITQPSSLAFTNKRKFFQARRDMWSPMQF